MRAGRGRPGEAGRVDKGGAGSVAWGMRTYSWLVAGALLAGCGGGEELEFGEFFAEAEATYCEWAARCGGFEDAATCGEVVFFDVLYPVSLFASGRLDSAGKVTVEYLRASHAAGRIAYDGAEAEKCLAYVAARGCERPESHEPDADELAGRAACAAIFRGTLADGEACGHGLECGGEGGGCYQEFCEDMCCPGTCQVPVWVPLGGSCSLGGVCETGTGCTYDEAKFDYFCAPLGQEGDMCGGGGAECGEGLVCDYNKYQCVRLGKIGEPCSSFGDNGCLPGGLCVDPDFDGSGRCEGYKALGEACGGYDCRDLDAACDSQAGKCVALPRAGEPCTGDFECAGSASCDFNAMTCVAAAKTGEPCGSDGMGGPTVECGGDLQCNGGSIVLNECLTPASYACPLPE